LSDSISGMRKYLLFSLMLATSMAVAQDAVANFKKQCALCHGPDGRAAVPMGKNLGAVDLTSAAVQKTSDAELKNIISKGKGKMPAYGNSLGVKGVDELVKYVRGLGKK